MKPKIALDPDGYWRTISSKKRGYREIVDRKGYDQNLLPLPPGFYWVKLKETQTFPSTFSKKMWVPAYWDGECYWWIIGHTNPCDCCEKEYVEDEGTKIAEVGTLCLL